MSICKQKTQFALNLVKMPSEADFDVLSLAALHPANHL